MLEDGGSNSDVEAASCLPKSLMFRKFRQKSRLIQKGTLPRPSLAIVAQFQDNPFVPTACVP